MKTLLIKAKFAIKIIKASSGNLKNFSVSPKEKFRERHILNNNVSSKIQS